MNIKTKRQQQGMTQKELSKKTKIDQASISRIENRKQGVSISQLIKIAEALNVELRELI